MKRFGYLCDVLGLLGVCIFMTLASLTLSLFRLLVALVVRILLRSPSMLLRPIWNVKLLPLSVVRKGNKIWLTLRISRLTLGIGFEKTSTGELLIESGTGYITTKDTQEVGSSKSVSVGAAHSDSEDEPQRDINGRMD